MIYCSIALASLAATVSAETLLWFADLHIEETENVDSIDSEREQLDLLFEHLGKHYDVHLTSLPLDRSLKLLNTGQTMCVSNVIKTPERQAFSHYSQAFSVSISPHLIYWQDDVLMQRLTKNLASADVLPLLLSDTDFTLGISEGRSYGAFLDGIFKREEVQAALYRRAGNNKTVSLMEMFTKRRFHAIVEYPVVVNKYVQSISGENRLKMLPVAHTRPYLTGHIACSKSDEGYQAVQHINAALNTLTDKYVYYSALSRPFLGTSIDVYNEAYQAVFGVLPKAD